MADTNRIVKRMPGGTRDLNREWLARLKKVETAMAATTS
jgi:hypothetical protein